MIITIALGVALGMILATIALFALLSNKTFVSWYVKYFIKSMETIEDELDKY